MLFCFLLPSAGATAEIAEPAASPAQAFLGVELEDVTAAFRAQFPELAGDHGGVVKIRRIVPGSAAAGSDLRTGDLLTSLHGRELAPTGPVKEFIARLGRQQPGDRLTVSGYRVLITLTQDGEVLAPAAAGLELGELLNRPWVGPETSISRQVKVEPLTLKIVLGSREQTLGKKLPELPENSPAGPGLPVAADHARLQAAATEITGLTPTFAEDAHQELPGVVLLETLLHRDPSALWPVGRDLSPRFLRAPPDLLLREGFRLLLPELLEPPSLPPLPTTREEAIAQLIAYLHFKKAGEARFHGELPTAEIENARTLLLDLLQLYGPDPEAAVTVDPAPLAEQLIALEKQINYQAMARLALYTIDFFGTERLRAFARLLPAPEGFTIAREGVVLVIGSAGDDQHLLAADLLLEFGGDDTYTFCREEHHLGVIIDYQGHDVYQSTVEHRLAGGLLELSLLLDLEGDDLYAAAGGSLGAGFGGVGILVDAAGSDTYLAPSIAMGIGMFGLGMLADTAGHDRYLSGFRAQGVGLAGGVGLLADRVGDDLYLARGSRTSSYGEPGLFDGFSQGIGVGLRRLCRGGVGLLVDAEGNDRYRSGNFSQGTGYFFGTGILLDGAGDDHYQCGRYGIGAAAHSASGLFLDLQGADRYETAVQAIAGAAWDRSAALFYDRAGDDLYRSPQEFSFGAADHNGIGSHFDLQGNDTYLGSFYTGQTNSYHGGRSVGLFLNRGGRDLFPEGLLEGGTRQAGDFFLVDLP